MLNTAEMSQLYSFKLNGSKVSDLLYQSFSSFKWITEEFTGRNIVTRPDLYGLTGLDADILKDYSLVDFEDLMQYNSREPYKNLQLNKIMKLLLLKLQSIDSSIEFPIINLVNESSSTYPAARLMDIEKLTLSVFPTSLDGLLAYKPLINNVDGIRLARDVLQQIRLSSLSGANSIYGPLMSNAQQLWLLSYKSLLYGLMGIYGRNELDFQLKTSVSALRQQSHKNLLGLYGLSTAVTKQLSMTYIYFTEFGLNQQLFSLITGHNNELRLIFEAASYKDAQIILKLYPDSLFYSKSLEYLENGIISKRIYSEIVLKSIRTYENRLPIATSSSTYSIFNLLIAASAPVPATFLDESAEILFAAPQFLGRVEEKSMFRETVRITTLSEISSRVGRDFQKILDLSILSIFELLRDSK